MARAKGDRVECRIDMTTGSLHSRLASLAEAFASDVLAAIRTASVDELTDTDRAPRRPLNNRVLTSPAAAPTPTRTPKGRLARRLSEDIAKTLGLVVAALKATTGEGMRAEEIQRFLKLDRRELPRVLAEGLKNKSLRKKGQKRATIYRAA